jgi:hypothetical protein
VPVFERQAAGIYRNSAASSTPTGRCSACIGKMHIPDDPLFYEKYYFTPGDGHFDYHGERAGEPTGFQVLEDPLRDDRRADLLGPVVSGGSADHVAHGRAGAVLSDGHRLAPAEKD